MSAEDAGSSSREYNVRIPSLFEIFWGKLANWFRLLAKWRKQGLLKKALEAARRRRAMRLEALEPRVLLSADISYSAPLLTALDLTLRFNENGSGDDVLELVNNADGSVIDSHPVAGDSLLEVNINGGQLEDKLVIDLSFLDGKQAQDAGSPPALKVNFDGKDESALPDVLSVFNDKLTIASPAHDIDHVYTLAGLDIQSTNAVVEVSGSVKVLGDMSIAVVGTDSGQYFGGFDDLILAKSVATVDVLNGAVIEASKVELTANSTLDLHTDGFGVSSLLQIAILDASSVARVSVDGA